MGIGSGLPTLDPDSEVKVAKELAQVTQSNGTLVASSDALRFCSQDRASLAPEDELFEFASTTIFSSSGEAPDLANSFIDLLLSRFTSTILKVSRKKLSIKANIRVDGLECTIKARLYALNTAGHAMELQRR